MTHCMQSDLGDFSKQICIIRFDKLVKLSRMVVIWNTSNHVVALETTYKGKIHGASVGSRDRPNQGFYSSKWSHIRCSSNVTTWPDEFHKAIIRLSLTSLSKCIIKFFSEKFTQITLFASGQYETDSAMIRFKRNIFY